MKIIGDLKEINMAHQLTKSELRETKSKREEFKNIPRNQIYLILDSLKCAHNIGTILRLADSLLVKKVYICGNTIVPPNIKIHKGSRGAENWVDWEYCENAEKVVKQLKEQNIEIVSLEVTSNSIDYRKYTPTRPVCLILGREFDGVSQNLIDLSDYCIHLPLLGMANSLNVSTATSVALYHIYDQLESKNLLK
ncbi:MAG: RNA methyltransferase [Christensenellales bacterium]